MDTTLLDLMFFDLFYVIEAFIEEIHPALKDEYYDDEDQDQDQDFKELLAYDESSDDCNITSGSGSELDDDTVSELEDDESEDDDE